MKRLTLLLFALIALFASVSVTASARAADASVTAILIQGSNEGGGVDSQLRRYERHLSHMLPFDTFKQRGQGSSRVSLPGNGSIDIGGGQLVAVKVEDGGGDKLRITARWTDGNRTLINTTIVSSRGKPTVLGGPSSGNGKLILLLIAQ